MRDNGTAHGCSNGVINDFRHTFIAHMRFTEVFPNTVKHHHRFINRITQYRQNPCQYRERKLPLEKGKEAQNNHHIVHIGNNGRHRKTPFKAHRQINDDAHHHHAQCQQTIAHQFLAHLRSNKLHLTHLHRSIVFAQDFHGLIG